MAYTVMAYTGRAHLVLAYIGMSHRVRGPGPFLSARRKVITDDVITIEGPILENTYRNRSVHLLILGQVLSEKKE